jgi:hypothetical protein
MRARSGHALEFINAAAQQQRSAAQYSTVRASELQHRDAVAMRACGAGRSSRFAAVRAYGFDQSACRQAAML